MIQYLSKLPSKVSLVASAMMLMFFGSLFGQSSYLPLNDDYYHQLDRYEIKAGKILPQLFTTTKPYRRDAIVSYVDSLQKEGMFETSSDQFNLSFFLNDNWEWSNVASAQSDRPILRHFYQKKADFFSYHDDAFDLHINPVLYVGLGKDNNHEDPLFVNTRGVEVRGMIDNTVGFYSYLADNQTLLPEYVLKNSNVVPHEGFYKRYKNGTAVDFLQARGYITFNASKHIDFQFGHDRIFLGNGYRSLVFSDFSPPFLFLKGNVKVWKFNYLFQMNQLTADTRGKNGYPIKYNALHHLSINLGKKLNIGIFESVIFSPDDTTGTNRFRIEYLNPVIFYRAIEQQNGSTDNVLLGLDFKWNALPKISFYGQFLLDELVIENVRERNGWWANKYGIQGGAKYVDALGISNLDLQGEINLVRPYTYSHFTNYGNYSHYRQSLAHPLGANFNEVIGIARYQPFSRLLLTAKLFFIETGRDSTTTENWGGDILKNNQTREKEFGNKTGQGLTNRIQMGNVSLTYQIRHNVFIDLNYIKRNSEVNLNSYQSNTSVFSFALRWNAAKRLYDF